MARFRIVPYDDTEDNPQVRLHYVPTYRITDEDDDIPIEEKDHMAIVNYTIYLLLLISDKPTENQRARNFYAAYRSYIEGRHSIDETSKENTTRMNKEFL